MGKKRNCRRTENESAIHDKAVKLRKMTDEQLVHYVEDRAAKARSEGFNQGNLAPDGFLEMDKLYQELSKEVMQYRKVGTVEECREAMEKQRAERPQLIGDGVDKDGNMIYDMYDCPDCGTRYEIDYEKYSFCPNCGQAIDWRDDE